MRKMVKVFMTLSVVGFVGCGGGGVSQPQGAIANNLPNGGMLKIPQHNQGQESSNQELTINGIWYLFHDRTYDNKIDLKRVSEILEFDRDGNVYNIANQNKQQIAKFELTQNSDLRMVDQNTVNIVRFNEVANEEGNCFYTTRTFSNQSQQEELWCKKPGTGVNSPNQSNSSQGTDVRPNILQPTGFQVDLKDYLYPDATIRNNSVTKEYVYNYELKSDKSIVYNGKVLKTFKKVFDPQGNTVIQEFINNKTQPKKEDIIYRDKIDSYSGFDVEHYPSEVQKNSVLTDVSSDGVDLRCVVSDLIGGSKNLSTLIPQEIQNHLKSKVTGSTFTDDLFQYTSVMHIHCGATNGATIDSYAVNGWGEVLSIYNYADNTTKYEILDKKSVQY